MKRILNSSWRKVISVFCAVTLLITVTAPSISAASNTANKQQESTEKYNEMILNKEKLDKIIEQTAKEIKQEAPKVNTSEPKVQPMAGGSLGLKLIKLLGKNYVKVKLPKKIYKAFPDALKDKVSQDTWIGVWNAYVLMGPLDEVKNTVADALKPYVWDWVATTCGYIAQGIVYAVI